MKILIITDSLGLPRKTPEVVGYNETWVYYLNSETTTHQLSLGGGLLRDFIKQLEYLKMFKPDKVIIQLGIVDCVPRALTERENHFVNKFWILKKIAIVYLKYKKKKLRGKRGICYTNEKDFAKGLSLIKKSFKNVFCLSIVKPCLVYEEKIPGVRHNVDLYNDILKKTFSENYIDVNDMDGTCIMSDHHHLNTKGHDYVFNKIKDRVLKEEEEEEKEEEMNNN